MAVARAVLSAISRFVSAMAMLNFGGQQKVSTSVQNFVSDDAEEAQFRVQHTTSSSGATATHSAQP
jgi:hypothetical protein